ncbi:hypothetical protein E2C01_058401 [Portunus trituberculatus]|uniref:Uncharacterized protein n=1 Tax=Portunus trituberculatus TaxID=210409 RepID=A0A5B7H2W4_PORTR|nr:hypothetical protein [Portunus trituberculatus]
MIIIHKLPVSTTSGVLQPSAVFSPTSCAFRASSVSVARLSVRPAALLPLHLKKINCNFRYGGKLQIT